MLSQSTDIKNNWISLLCNFARTIRFFGKSSRIECFRLFPGPTLHTQSLPSSTCPPERWHFTTCPLCQCNGHASCNGNTSICLPCNNLTTGNHCEHCSKGYYGNPVNGGKCQPCECNKQADNCHPETGKCYCTTKGLTGDHCEKCDATNHYHSDPINKDSCYCEYFYSILNIMDK